jgi:hypothetical protein
MSSSKKLDLQRDFAAGIYEIWSDTVRKTPDYKLLKTPATNSLSRSIYLDEDILD